MESEISLQLSPAWCLRQGLEGLRERSTRLLLRAVLCASAGGIRVEGAGRLARIPDPAVFALSHHSAYEALLAPAALIALRGGRRVRFLVDWMYLELPLAGSILRHGEPIAVYRKPARWRWREQIRRKGLRAGSPCDRALAALRRGISVGIYPEGRRNPDPWQLAPLRRGAAVLATRAGTPLVPIGIDFPARERLGRVPRLGRMVLRIGEALRAEAAAVPAEARVPEGAETECEASERSRAVALSRQLQTALADLARKTTPT